MRYRIRLTPKFWGIVAAAIIISGMACMIFDLLARGAY